MGNVESRIRELLNLYQRKIESGVLPPDPLRVVKQVLRIPVSLEHVAPVPPILEYVHSKYVEPAIESAPRLPMTSDFPEEKWLHWIKESW